jgi:hypothetical protein
VIENNITKRKRADQGFRHWNGSTPPGGRVKYVIDCVNERGVESRAYRPRMRWVESRDRSWVVAEWREALK